MKPWKQFGFPPAIGLMIGQQQIAMSVTAAAIGGRREVAREIQPCDQQSPEEVLGRMLRPWVSAPGAKRSQVKPWVRVGLPEPRVFEAALPIIPSNCQHTAQNFFLEAVQTTNVRAEDRIVELIKLDLDNRPLACVAASPRDARRAYRARPHIALPRRRVLPQGAARLKVVCAFLSG